MAIRAKKRTRLARKACHALLVQHRTLLVWGLWIASASWTADDGADNRDGGPMNNVFSACNGGDQCKMACGLFLDLCLHARVADVKRIHNADVRYRTGGSPSITTALVLAQPSDVAGVSITVRQSPDTDGEGYSGIEISVSSDGGM